MIRHDPKVSQYNPNIKRWGDVDKTLMNGDTLSYSVTGPKKMGELVSEGWSSFFPKQIKANYIYHTDLAHMIQ